MTELITINYNDVVEAEIIEDKAAPAQKIRTFDKNEYQTVSRNDKMIVKKQKEPVRFRNISFKKSKLIKAKDAKPRSINWKVPKA